MIALTKVLFEYPVSDSFRSLYRKNVGNTVMRPEEAEEAAKQEATKQVADKTTNVIMPPVTPTTQAVKHVIKGDKSEYQQNLRKTFNALPNRGRDLRIAGIGQKNPVDPEHQAQFDTKFKQVAAANKELNPAGVPRVAAKGVAKIVQPVNHEMSGVDAAKHALKKGAEATGEAISSAGRAVASGAKSAAEHLTDHPVAAALTAGAGAAGAIGLRKLLRGKDK